MADNLPVIFGPGDKLRWLEAVASAEGASDIDSRIAIAISRRIDKHTGVAAVDQVGLAAFIHATDRGIRKATARMVATGLLVIDRSAVGRGKANIYRPVCPAQTRNRGSCETRNETSVKAERNDRKPGTVVPPLPKKNLNSSSARVREVTPGTPEFGALLAHFERSGDSFRLGQMKRAIEDRKPFTADALQLASVLDATRA